ncbi:MAG TPA: carboxypeptidase regulatory-like domain-containing protein [Candidatus Baltobacteraceae bacterium]|nr:carboxypeptidase regulatory-like domain-containing protein [Candidatus Baltobacteraceae bacterium]
MVGQTLRVLGVGVLFVAGAWFIAPVLPARAQILAPLEAIAGDVRRIAQAVSPDQAPSPLPSPTPTATPPPLQTARGGPLLFSLTGSLGLGTRLQNSTQDGGALFPGPSPSPSATPFGIPSDTESQNQTLSNAGMLADVSRRTALSSLDVKVPIGFGNQGSQLGTVGALYSTPKYSLGYGMQFVNLFGQLPAGGTQRGPFLILPLAYGNQTIYEGPTTGANGELIRLFGYRLSGSRGNNYWEAGVASADGPLTGKTTTLLGGVASALGPVTLISEMSLQSRTNVGPGQGSPTGLATAFRFEDTVATSDLSLSIRHIPDQYVSYGVGAVERDDFIGTNYSLSGRDSQNLLLDASWERYGDNQYGISTQRFATANYSGPWLIGDYSAGVQAQELLSTTSSPEATVGATVQNASNSRIGTIFTGLQLLRTTQEGIGVTASTGVSFALDHQFGLFSAGFGGQALRQTTSDASPSLQVLETFNVQRQFGKTTIGIADALAHSISGGTPGSNAISQTPLLTVGRQISPTVTVSATYGLQTMKDRLNPAANGHSRVFSLQVNSPFAFGNNIVTGRTDPRLPATIVGRVQTDLTTLNPALAGFATLGGTNGGVGNIVLTLDDRYVQRTDLTGGFQFSFIPPGQHQLRIETSSLPRGLTVDQPVETITVSGGQTAQVLFQISNLGGVLGHVYGLDQAGNVIPLPNVMVRVDDNQYSQTDTTGAYGFGHLAPGPHEITIVASTVPAYVTFDTAGEKQTITVQNGQYSKADFRAQPLGSISGKIVYAPDMKPLTGGVMNAYVVAEPGEHAAIDDEDGSFVIDNLPPGDYTVSVDPETLEESLGAAPEGVSVHLDAEEHYEGVVFRVGKFEKKVVFSFLGSKGGAAPAAAVRITLSEPRLPPAGSASAFVPAPETAKAVTLAAFGKDFPLAYDAARKGWAGELRVPVHQEGGSYLVTATVAAGTAPPGITVTVDPKMPIAIIQYTPASPAQGEYVRVRARFLVDAKPGDKIEWEDGQTTILGKPVSGRVFTFTKVLSLRPLHGVLLTGAGRLPIELL